MKKITALFGIIVIGSFGFTPLFAEEKSAGEMTQVKGEILDMGCYLDHGAMGEKHAGCAKKCIEGGLPVGIKGEDGKVYFVLGNHKPLNKELADSASKVVTLKGKVVTRDGVNLLENAELVK